MRGVPIVDVRSLAARATVCFEKYNEICRQSCQ